MRVRRSSTSSTWSQKGTIDWANPPVAIAVASSPELLAQPAEDGVHLAGVPVDHARLDRLGRALPDRVARGLDVHPRQPRRPGGQRLQRDLDPGRDHAAQVLAVAGHHVVVDGGAEVDRDARRAHAVVGGHRVHQPVRARAPAGCRSGSASPFAATGPRAPRCRRGSARSAGRTRARARARPTRRSRRSRRGAGARGGRAGSRRRRPARRRWRSARSRSASAPPARPRRTSRGGSGCCRRRWLGARRDYR